MAREQVVPRVKTLLLDIETAPNKAYVWGLFDQNIAANQLENSSYVLCWAAKWLDGKDIVFDSVKKSGHKKMLVHIHKLLDEADVVVHYNGVKFDIPTLNKEFLKHGLTPPSPFKQVDLMRVVKRAFRFESNRLDYVCTSLGIGSKEQHQGFELWVKCMEGDAEAWKTMERYNRGDVTLLQKLYDRLLPWVEKHPNTGAYTDVSCCPKCGSTSFQARGYAVATMLRYKRYQCNGCGGWFRGNKHVGAKLAERMTNVVS